MIIAVAGGTGTAGRAVVAEIHDRGHHPRVVARHRPRDLITDFVRADVTTDDSLDDALTGAEALIDCTNITSTRRATATAFFQAAAGNLATAAARVGVQRYVLLSIAGIDGVPTGYYRAKLAHEAAARHGPVQTVVVRATQFHDFADQILRLAGLGPVAAVPAMPIQPVDTRDVAKVLVDAAVLLTTGDQQLRGPRRETLPDLARRSLAHPANGRTPRRTFVVQLPLPGAAGRAIRAGSLIPAEGHVGTVTFEDYLKSR